MRFTAAAKAAGITARLTAHSGRVGLASELTARGASTTEVILARAWKRARPRRSRCPQPAVLGACVQAQERALQWDEKT